MPPRRKPTSTKAKKAQQQLNRAIKRGEVEAPKASSKPKRPRKGHVGPTGRALNQSQKQVDATDASKRLQSSFVKVSPQFIETTKSLASSLVLPRPIDPHAAIFDERQWDDAISSGNSDGKARLTCPRRPKWNFDMSKKEVEANEEGVFRKWLQETDRIVEDWQKDDQPSISEPAEGDDADQTSDPPRMPRSTTYFERNLEVWRQLWRVTEISDILLVLVDCRCPILHYPPTLASYLSNRRVILVLTKVDITGPARAAAWEVYFKNLYPTTPIVQVEAYRQKEESAAHQGRKLFEAHIPQSFRDKLVGVIQEVHQQFLEPPERVKSSPRAKEWKPSVKTQIDWDAIRNATGDKVGTAVGGSAAPRPESNEDDDAGPEQAEGQRSEPEFLTVGLIGQPNVGKSSLLNALFGASKVRASRTPGKTKHFQTLFWTSDLRLVDCPGLVLPNLVPLETQIMLGIFPIARVNAIPSSIHIASLLLPIEQILNLKHPDADEPVVEDKRTYRNADGKIASRPPKVRETTWTAMDVLTAYADRKGWVTAKAGRSDVNRAGNAVLRALAEGRIPWGFWPAGVELPAEATEATGHGLWIAGGNDDSNDLDEHGEDSAAEDGDDGDGSSESEDEDEDEDEDGDDIEEEDEESEEEGEAAPAPKVVSGPRSGFAMLELDGGDDGDDDDSDADSGDAPGKAA
ncbi:hypothetical protein BDV98DRAFT_570680 [Pterulicium gracile]|uniref:Guanine nucleotide-binding protein-like 1 n=1 Tax=Pterulicium gracile TaxID=1884261 RepID=A0A5C3QCB8_9AGAR|nr:hypothetical protein BDV98DRAFT_570680 [Pterula gracilis]